MMASSTGRAPSRTWKERLLFAWPSILLAVVGLALIALFFYVEQTWQLELHASRFAILATNAAASLQASCRLAVATAEHTAALFTSSSFVSPSEFRDFVRASRLIDYRSGVVAVEWLRRIVPGENYREADELRAWGVPAFANFSVKPVTPGASTGSPYQYPVTYVVPWAGNEAAIGLDAGSSDPRLQPLLRSSALHSPVVSDAIVLVQANSSHSGYGFLTIMPVFYVSGQTPAPTPPAVQPTPSTVHECSTPKRFDPTSPAVDAIGFALSAHQVHQLMAETVLQVNAWASVALKDLNSGRVLFLRDDCSFESATTAELATDRRHCFLGTDGFVNGTDVSDHAWSQPPGHTKMPTDLCSHIEERVTINMADRHWELIMRTCSHRMSTTDMALSLLLSLVLGGLAIALHMWRVRSRQATAHRHQGAELESLLNWLVPPFVVPRLREMLTERLKQNASPTQQQQQRQQQQHHHQPGQLTKSSGAAVANQPGSDGVGGPGCPVAFSSNSSGTTTSPRLVTPFSPLTDNDLSVVVDRHDNVACFISDVCGFTEFCSSNSPVEVFTVLNALFRGFDSLCEQCGMLKIDTTGDAYFAVAGVPGQPGDTALDNARRVAQFSLRVCKFMKKFTRDHGLSVRIGLHVGPVATGIIGSKVPRLDCLGDTVNVASRMESSGTSGHIHCSAQFHDLLHTEFPFSRSRKVFCKGKGLLKGYFLHCPQDKRAQSQRRNSAAPDGDFSNEDIEEGRENQAQAQQEELRGSARLVDASQTRRTARRRRRRLDH